MGNRARSLKELEQSGTLREAGGYLIDRPNPPPSRRGRRSGASGTRGRSKRRKSRDVGWVVRWIRGPDRAEQPYVGYDSAGGHVPAASGGPMVSIFGGFASERMFQRWRPVGPGPIQVVRVSDAEAALTAVLASLSSA